MEVTYKSKLSSSDFFQAINDLILIDINYAAEKPVKALKKCLKFNQKTLRGQQTLCTILDYNQNDIITIEYRNRQLRSVLSYKFSSENEGSLIICTARNYSLEGKELFPSTKEEIKATKQINKRLKLVETFIKNKNKQDN